MFKEMEKTTKYKNNKNNFIKKNGVLLFRIIIHFVEKSSNGHKNSIRKKRNTI